MQLPKEIRQQILQYSDLVDSRFGSQFQQCIVFKNNRIQIRNVHADQGQHTYRDDSDYDSEDESEVKRYCDHCPHILSGSLLAVNKQLREDALEVALTSNLLVLQSGHVQNLEFLQSLAPSIRNRIKHLDIKFNYDLDFHDENEFDCCMFRSIPDFDRLIEYIAAHMNLPQLNMSLNLMATYADFFDGYISEPEVLLHLRSLKRLAQPLHQLRGIRRLYVFLPLHTEYEENMEKAAVGHDYDSYRDGKVPLKQRNPFSCHSLPETENAKSVAKKRRDVAWMAERGLDDRPVEEIIKKCPNQDWFSGMPIPRWPKRGTGQEWFSQHWYDH